MNTWEDKYLVSALVALVVATTVVVLALLNAAQPIVPLFL